MENWQRCAFTSLRAMRRCAAQGGWWERREDAGGSPGRGSHPALRIGRGSSALSMTLQVGLSFVTPLVTAAAGEVSVTR